MASGRITSALPVGGGFGAMVDVVEHTGADTLVFARVGNQKICGAFADRYNFRSGDASPSRRAPTACTCSIRLRVSI
jgi:hypothetical protein